MFASLVPLATSPSDASAALDLTRITSIGLVPQTGGGHAWIIDVSAVPAAVPDAGATPSPSAS